MTESETFVEQWDDEAADDKSELLEELILVQADDVGKLDVNEVMLRYFENRQKLGCDSWDNDNQALRQLFSASSRVPRVRHFPGSAGRVVGRPKLPAGGVARRPLAQQQPLRLIDASDSNSGASRQKPTKQAGDSDPTRQLAEHLIASEDTYEGIERELAALSERLVEQSLTQAVYNSAVHQLAVRLVRRALARASEQLGSRHASDLDGSSKTIGHDDNESARIDAIAQELARNAPRGGDPRELTFTSDRAASVAEGLLDQVLADAAEVVSGDKS